MSGMVANRVVSGTLVALVVLALGASAQAASGPDASSRATGVSVSVPGGPSPSAAGVSAPPRRSTSAGGWSYADGAVVIGPATSAARAAGGKSTASASVRSVSLFGGEITADAVFSKASAHASGKAADGSLGASSVANLVILGQAVSASPNKRVVLADWGYVVLLEQAVVRQKSSRLGYRGFVSGLHVVLTSAHGGLPTGTEVVVGYSEAAASAPKAAPPPLAPPPPTTKPPREPVAPPVGVPQPQPQVRTPPDVDAKLTAGGYVFPVYGPSSFSDDFGAPRATTGWHHGNDIFATLGAPVLAVADGTLFNVGWNDVGGNRLWVRDQAGNEFYYAHLSAYSSLAREGAQVKAGDVVGFVGTTGDAAGTPPHLHFEVHPRQLLWMGYDGAVDPYPYLLAWQRLDDLDFGGWQPSPGKAPQAGAVLLEADDISTLSGLGDETFSSYLVMPELFGEGAAEPVIVGADPAFGD
jgi:murein DD-endopeptidase MepM/ murein hydrolase activator NlpD